MNRALEIAGFLAQAGWDRAECAPFDADFSPRRYARLTQANGSTAILLDAGADQKTPQFVALAKRLRELGLSAPAIYAADPPQGIALIEDFGNRNFGRLLDKGAAPQPLYRRAVDVLARVHGTFTVEAPGDHGLPVFDATLFTAQAELFLDAYIPHTEGREATAGERDDFRAAWFDVLNETDALPRSLLLRDFMPDNLMDLPDRKGVASVGLLDFQDAGIGPIAYDLASLCEVVRRDGGGALLDEMIGYYHEQARPAATPDALKRACIILSAQRHLRILGVLARLAANGRVDKPACIPRVQAFLERMSDHPALKPVSAWLSPSRICG